MKMGGKGTARVARSCIKFFSDLHSEGRRELVTEEAQETCMFIAKFYRRTWLCLQQLLHGRLIGLINSTF